MRRRYMIAYDIHDPVRLRRVCKVMEGSGERLQYSVFICDLTRGELVQVRAKTEAQMRLSEDSLVIVDLGNVDGAKFTFVGQRRPLPETGPQIV